MGTLQEGRDEHRRQKGGSGKTVASKWHEAEAQAQAQA